MKNIFCFCHVFIVALAAVFMTACSEHETTKFQDMRVGSVLLSNNTLVAPENITDDMKPVGVVFWTSGDSALVVAPQELGSYAYCDTLANISSVSSETTTLDGLTSTAALLASGYSCPAAAATYQYNRQSSISGWFLPSAGELRLLSANMSAVRRAMTAIGGDDFSDEQYISSSQDGSSDANSVLMCYCVSLINGYVTSTNKLERHLVRPVLLIH